MGKRKYDRGSKTLENSTTKSTKEIHLILNVDSLGTFQNCFSSDDDQKQDLSDVEIISVNTKCPECCFSLEIILHKIVEIKKEPSVQNEETQLETFVAPAGFDSALVEPKIEMNNDFGEDDNSAEDSNCDEPEFELTSNEDHGESIPVQTESQNISLPMQKLQCQTCNETFLKQRTLDDHLRNVHGILQNDLERNTELTCIPCSKTFKSNRTFQYHLKNVHKEKLSNEEAIDLGAPLSKKKKRHLTKAEKIEREMLWAVERAKNPPPQEFPKEGELLCKVCNKMFGNTSKLKAHLRKLHNVKEGKRIVTNPYKPEPGEFVCPKCNREFTAPGNYGYHIKTCNPDLDYTTLTCLLCNMKCASKQRLYSHYDRIHKRKICDQCGKSFSKAQSLAEHITKHLNPEPYLCDLCDTRFRSKDQVETHMLKKHMTPTCYCNQCDPPKPFAKDFQLRKHIQRVHLKVKTVQCPECPYICKNDFDLKKHLFARHTAPEIKNQFPCDQCDFVTSTEPYLRKHKLTHLPDEQRPFKCQYCIKGFRLVYDLERHEMSHNGIRPYPCKVCGKGFITNTELKQHYIAQHTDDRPFVCEICNAGHKDRWAYRNHLTAHERQMGITLDKSIGKFMYKYRDLQL